MPAESPLRGPAASAARPARPRQQQARRRAPVLQGSVTRQLGPALEAALSASAPVGPIQHPAGPGSSLRLATADRSPFADAELGAVLAEVTSAMPVKQMAIGHGQRSLELVGSNDAAGTAAQARLLQQGHLEVPSAAGSGRQGPLVVHVSASTARLGPTVQQLQINNLPAEVRREGFFTALLRAHGYGQVSVLAEGLGHLAKPLGALFPGVGNGRVFLALVDAPPGDHSLLQLPDNLLLGDRTYVIKRVLGSTTGFAAPPSGSGPFCRRGSGLSSPPRSQAAAPSASPQAPHSGTAASPATPAAPEEPSSPSCGDASQRQPAPSPSLSRPPPDPAASSSCLPATGGPSGGPPGDVSGGSPTLPQTPRLKKIPSTLPAPAFAPSPGGCGASPSLQCTPQQSPAKPDSSAAPPSLAPQATRASSSPDQEPASPSTAPAAAPQEPEGPWEEPRSAKRKRAWQQKHQPSDSPAGGAAPSQASTRAAQRASAPPKQAQKPTQPAAGEPGPRRSQRANAGSRGLGPWQNSKQFGGGRGAALGKRP